jgi:hypothetical protein
MLPIRDQRPTISCITYGLRPARQLGPGMELRVQDLGLLPGLLERAARGRPRDMTTKVLRTLSYRQLACRPQVDGSRFQSRL